MNEVIFVVKESPQGGFVARALDAPIFTIADDAASLHQRLRDAVRCHFENEQIPKHIRLHFIRDEVIAV